jgi:hypothetical protein
LHRHGGGQLYLEACRLETIDQPIPVVGRLDHDTEQFGTMRFEQREDFCQLIRTAPTEQDPVRFVGNHYNAVV